MGAPLTVPGRLLNIAEFHRIGEAGILREDDRIELIEGEMIEMAPIGSRHLAKVNRLARLLSRQIGELAIVSVQNPIALPPHNEPQPDIALLKPRADDYESALPTADDVLLVVEIADTTLNYDRDAKLPTGTKGHDRTVVMRRGGDSFVRSVALMSGFRLNTAPRAAPGLPRGKA